MVDRLWKANGGCQGACGPQMPDAKLKLYAIDALRVENTNLRPGDKQACYGRASCTAKDYHRLMSFPLDYCSRELTGKPKGIKRVLKERGSWPSV